MALKPQKMKNSKINFFITTALDISRTCDSYCPLECDSSSYSLSLNSASYPTEYYWGILLHQSNLVSKAKVSHTYTPQSVSMDIKPMCRRKRQAPSQPNQQNVTNSQNNSTFQSNQNLSPSVPVIDVNSVKNSILKISVFFQELRYTYVAETPAMDFLTLIGVICNF
jgi:hypothetical protein